MLKIRELENYFVPLLQKCGNIKALKIIHTDILKNSLSQSNFLVTKMVDVCDEYGDLDYARLLFVQVTDPNVFLFNAVIRAYAHNYKYSLAISLYKQMLDLNHKSQILPDKFTFPFVVKSCAGLQCDSLGKQVHAHLSKFGPKSQLETENALVDMYSKFDNLEAACKVFDEMTHRDVISWNSLISGYVRVGVMRKAKMVFDLMPFRTIVSWTAMISGYTRSSFFSEALDIFRRMQMAGIEPDEISMVSVLPACAQSGALELGKWIHTYCDKNRLLRKITICNALIEMYSKCGCINEAKRVFDQMRARDVISWSTMISGLANHGKAEEAINLFKKMRKTNVEPNAITFVGILSACAHTGLWQEGLNYFESMRKQYHIEPEIEHYGCLVDILGRTGRVSQAMDVITDMPLKADAKIWGSLLSSCRSYPNLEIAIIAVEKLEEFEPDDTGNYVLLSNIYADLGKWDDVSKMRKLIRSKSMKKTPGCSLIEVDNVVHEFVSGDDTKAFSKNVFALLELLLLHHGDRSVAVAEIEADY
ncbi:hypothetical protein ACFE04_019326 [Oxalis oulophora]